MMQTLSPNKFFFFHNTILAGLKKVKTTHHMRAKRPTSEMTHGRNYNGPVNISATRDTVKVMLLRMSISPHDVHCAFPQSPKL